MLKFPDIPMNGDKIYMFSQNSYQYFFLILSPMIRCVLLPPLNIRENNFSHRVVARSLLRESLVLVMYLFSSTSQVRLDVLYTDYYI